MQKIFVNYQESNPETVARRAFVENTDSDTLCEQKSFAVLISTADFLRSIKTIAANISPGSKVRISSYEPNYYQLHIAGPRPALIDVTAQGRGGFADRARKNFAVVANGDIDFIVDLFGRMSEKYGESRIATALWWYKATHGVTFLTVPIEPPLPVYDAYYPYIPGGVDAYLDAYINSSAAVLFMMGPPGTGKTSLVRHLVFKYGLAVSFSYEADLLNSDQMFVQFMANQDQSVMLIEDADLLVGSRENDRNPLITRFLNVSDGLIKTGDKKLIFTTNMHDFAHVDPALVRSGRCFDSLRFRELTASEASLAASVAGVADPGVPVVLSNLFKKPSLSATTLAEKVGY